MTAAIPERVARGVALLDEKLPGWDGRIDLDNLDLTNACDCILGQEFDDPFRDGYYVGLDELFSGSTDEAIQHGFNVDTGGIEWSLLEVEWRRVVLARREGSA